jgi:hypothetical protein
MTGSAGGRLRVLSMAALALAAISRGGATLTARMAELVRQPHETPPPEQKRERRAYQHLRRLAGRAARSFFLKQDRAGPRWRAYRLPHSAPTSVAIVRDATGKRTYNRGTFSHAKPPEGTVRIEYLNGFGQVVRRVRLGVRA